MNKRIVYRIIQFTALVLGFLPGLLAQAPPSNKPSTATQTPAPTVTVATPQAKYGGGANPKINYIRTREAEGRIQDPATFANAAYQDVMESTKYVDGLGRQVQTVSRQLSPGSAPKDVVEPMIYDQFGRESYKYLPYVETQGTSTIDGKFKLSPFIDQAAFYNSVYPTEQPSLTGEQVYYQQLNLEASPLNRLLSDLPPGNSWAGSNRGASYQYLTNTTADAVRLWTISGDPLPFDANGNADISVVTNIPVTTSAYTAGQLYKKVTIDEHNNAIVEYKDKNGRVVLKKVQIGAVTTDFSGYTNWLCTYYIYDDLNNLRFVIPPKAVAALIGGGWTFTGHTDLVTELCFRYEFDDRTRLSARKLPGKGWEYYVYDQRDRLVFTQDANMRVNRQWLTTLYDVTNRKVLEGITTTSAVTTPSSLQTSVNTLTLPVTQDPTLLPDLELNTLRTGTFQASRSILLSDGFIADGAAGVFIAQIITPASPSEGPTTLVEGILVDNDPIPSGNSFVALKKFYFDDYSWSSNTYTTTYNGAVDAGTNLHAETLPNHGSLHTRGMETGAAVRAIEDPNNLGLGGWLTTVGYYDDRGRLVQAQATNYKGGNDIVVNQYDFSGKALSSYLVHNNPAAGSNSTLHIKGSVNYDPAGRPLQKYETVNDDPSTSRLTSQMSYDQAGELKQKQLGKQQDGSFLETLDYSYNIRGWLKGINKDYSNNDNSHGSNQRWFGMELSYDWGFGNNQYTGSIAGIKWRSKGDGQQRAFGLGYDAANRLLAGDFSQLDGSTGAYADNATMNFDIMLGNGTDPATAYDESGNIKAMKQWGLKNNASSLIDDLTYTYNTNSNRLKNVLDGQNDAQSTLGDFHTSSLSPYNTGKTIAATDYNYDVNGNLTRDLNKDLGTATTDAIIYNHLNLPYQATFRSASGTKGTITYVYDADGNKLKKTIVDNAAGLQKTITYIRDMIYESIRPSGGSTSPDTLRFISNSDGRVRPVTTNTTGTPSTAYYYDYFVKDQQENTRMVLSEQKQVDIYPAVTLENNNTPATDPLTYESNYYSINSGQIKSKPSGVSDYQNNNGNGGFPANNNPNCNSTSAIKATDISQKLYLMNMASTAKTGLGITVKVMSGDRLDIFGKSYYTQANTGGQAVNLSMAATELIAGLLGAPASPAFGHATAAQIGSNTAGTLTPLNNFISNHDNPAAESTPRAYINYVFFDDQFNYAGGGASQVHGPNVVTDHYTVNQLLNNITAPKNGYVYVFCSNESPVDVFFDNLQVILTHGPLVEETHYYPFGLTMAGISDKALMANYNVNRYKYNAGSELANKEFSDGSGLELYETDFRSYDPALGRFWQHDPLSGFTEGNSPYAYAANNPALLNDPMGLMSDPDHPQERETVYWIGYKKDCHGCEVVRHPGNLGIENNDGGSGGGREGSSSRMNQPSENSVGQPGLLEGAIPVWGAGRAAIDDFQNGRWGWGLFNSMMVVLDVVSLGESTAIRGVIKAGVELGAREIAEDGARGLAEEAAKEGVYNITTKSGERYIGQSQNMLARVKRHFRPSGKLGKKGHDLGQVIMHTMEGSTQMEREVYEHYVIDSYGIENLINIRMPMGERLEEYGKMIENVIQKYNLPRYP